MALAVMNITGMFYNQDIGISNIIGIIAYQNQPLSRIQYAAIDLSIIPKRLTVSDEQACALTEDIAHWRAYSISCFQLQENAIPVLDLSRVFVR